MDKKKLRNTELVWQNQNLKYFQLVINIKNKDYFKNTRKEVYYVLQ